MLNTPPPCVNQLPSSFSFSITYILWYENDAKVRKVCYLFLIVNTSNIVFLKQGFMNQEKP